MIGKTIGRYQIIDKLGEGGMGTVYKAEDTTLNRTVALKSLSGHLAENEEAKERFLREAQAASALNHNNITTVYDLLEDGEQHFICMEYVDGKTLRDLVASGRVSVKKAVDIILQTAEALEAAHNKGILHRDIKSANIMVNVEDQVKVMDFGLAHLEERSQLTRTGTTMGTLSYASPEQVSGRKVDARSEIFSLGVVSYELLTGQLPFTGTSEAETVLAIISGEAKPISEHRGDVSDSLEAVVSRMVQKDPELRYQTCTELISDLRTIEAGLETSTMPITAALSAARTARRKAMAVRVAAGATVVAVAVTVYLAVALLNRGGSNLDPNRVAVAIFENMTGDESLGQIGNWAASSISQGITQTGLVDVVGIEVVRTISRTFEVEAEAGEGAGRLTTLAERTKAGTIVTGALYLVNPETIRLEVEIHDMRSGKLLSSPEPVRGALEDAEQVVEQLRQRVMGAMASHFDPQFETWVSITGRPPSLEAFKQFQEGVELFLSEKNKEALPHFYRAAALDSTYLSPILWAARIEASATADSLLEIVERSRERLLPMERYLLDYLLGGVEGDLEKQYRIAKAAAEQAPGTFWSYEAGMAATRSNRPREGVAFFYEVDPAIKEWSYYWNRLSISLHMLGDHEEELRQARIAMETRPNMIWSLMYLGRALVALGELDEIRTRLVEALQHSDQMQATSASMLLQLGMMLKGHGHHEMATEMLERSVQWFEARSVEEKQIEDYRANYGAALYLLERWEDAQKVFEGLAREFPDVIGYLGRLGTLAARRGDIEEAHRISDLLASIDRPYLYGAHTIRRARIAAQLGELEQAVQLRKEAYRQGKAFIMQCLELDIEPLRDYPAYQEFIRPKG